LCLALSITLPAAGQTPEEVLQKALAHLEIASSQLSVTAPPDLLGHPAPHSIPFLLPLHEAVTSDPAHLLRLGENLSAVACLAQRDALPRPPLPAVVTAFLLQPRLPGFRGFEISVTAMQHPGALTAVLTELGIDTNEVDPLAPVPMGNPDEQQKLAAVGVAESRLAQPLRQPVAMLLRALLEARRWVDRSWYGLTREELSTALRTPLLAEHLAAGTIWWPAVDRAARLSDDTARAYAALLVVTAVERAVPLLQASRAQLGDWSGTWEVSTSLGRVIVAGVADDTHRCQGDCLLLVELGGNDRFRGSVGAGRYPDQPVSLALDLGGDDIYQQTTQQPGPGSGIGGVGVVVDCAGDDRYEAAGGALGFGLLGYGVLADDAGNDTYTATSSSQGAALFGGGLLLDKGGNDRYLVHGEGQGFGGPWGCGALLDLAGNDQYTAVADPEVAGRADYHTAGRVAANNSQGAGVGRRGDVSDGHLWAGGLGVLADVAGSDTYRAGTFSQGMGYWFGTGMLLDAAGDDSYHAVCFSQGAGVHLAAGLLLDEGSGRDAHLLSDEARASLGYGLDFAVGMLVDGGGDDQYRLRTTSLASAEQGAVALVLEMGGNDTYTTADNGSCFGVLVNPSLSFPSRAPVSAAMTAAHGAVFLDVGGNDRYPEHLLARGGANNRLFAASQRMIRASHLVCGIGWDGELAHAATP